MSATFTWAITQMQAYPQADGETDVVFQVTWVCTGVEVSGGNTYQTSSIGFQPVTYTAGTPFTPYDQLTEAQVLQWVFDALGTEGVNAVQDGVQSVIDAQINPPVVQLPLPWVTPAA